MPLSTLISFYDEQCKTRVFIDVVEFDWCCVDYSLYNALHATLAVIGRCPWSTGVQTHGWRHGEILFFVLSNMARGFENVCEIISNWASEDLEKSLAGVVYKHEKLETKAKSVLVDSKMPKLEQIFKTAASLYEKSHSFENICSIILLWASEGLGKSLG